MAGESPNSGNGQGLTGGKHLFMIRKFGKTWSAWRKESGLRSEDEIRGPRKEMAVVQGKGR